MGEKRYKRIAGAFAEGTIGLTDFMYRVPTKLRVLKEIKRLIDIEIEKIERKKHPPKTGQNTVPADWDLIFLNGGFDLNEEGSEDEDLEKMSLFYGRKISFFGEEKKRKRESGKVSKKKWK